MKICFWNIRGGGSGSRRGLMSRVLRKEKRDIVVLQDIKRESVDSRFVASLWKLRFIEWVFLPAVGRSGGILVMWDSRLVSVKDNLIRDFSVSIEIEMNCDIKWWFSAIYGPCKQKERELFWDELAG